MGDSLFDLQGSVGLDTAKVESGFDAMLRKATQFGDRVSSTLEGAGKRGGELLSKGIKIGLGDVGAAVDSLVSITESGLKGIPVVGAGIAAAFHEVSGVMLDATARGFAYNDLLKEQRIQLDLVTGSAEETRRQISEIGDIAYKTNVGKFILTDAVQDLQLFNVDAERALALVRGLANQATATGGGEGRVVALTDLVERVLETGKLDTRAMRQLIRQKIPVYDIIAEELQVSKREAMQLISSGTLSGNDLITIFTHQFNSPKWQQSAEEMTQTIDGLTARYKSGVNKLLGVATKPAYDTSVQTLSDANAAIRSKQAGQMAAQAQAALTPVTTMISNVEKALANGDLFGGALSTGQSIVEGLKKGVEEKAGEVLGAVKNLAGNVINTVTGPEGFDVNSPSKKMIPVGESVAEGVVVGFEDFMDGEGLLRLTTSINETVAQVRSRTNLERLTKREPDFLPTLRKEAERRGINPDHLLNVMALETAGTFRKNIDNGMGYVGLIQFGQAARKDVGLPAGTAEAQRYLSGISATEQLAYVFRYLDQHAHDASGRRMTLDTQSKVYAAVGPGHLSPSDDTVLWRSGSRGFANNQAWNYNHDSSIQQWELGKAAEAKLGAGINFTVNGGAITNTNPMPVAVVSTAASVSVAQSTAPATDANAPVLAGIEPVADTLPSGVWKGVTATHQALQPLIVDFDKLGDSADSAGDRTEADLEQIRSRVKGLGAEFKKLGLDSQTIGASFEQNFVSAFDAIGEEGHNFARDLSLGILRDVQHNVGAGLAHEFEQMLFGDGQPGGSKGLFGSIFKSIGGGSTAVATATTNNSVQVTANTTQTTVNTAAIQLNTAAVQQLAVSSQVGGGGGGGFLHELLHTAIGAVAGGLGGAHGGTDFTPGGKFKGFATGGDFVVGGAGGTDSQLVRFKATPGEHVSIRTPAQREQGAGSYVDNRKYITVNQHFGNRSDTIRTPAGAREFTEQLKRALR
jgi:tape measure domain-containing protein